MEEVDGLVTCVKNIYEPDVGGLFVSLSWFLQHLLQL